jgi:hypothetical protein
LPRVTGGDGIATNGREGSEGKAQGSARRREKVVAARMTWTPSACRTGTGFRGAEMFAAGMAQLSRLPGLPAMGTRPRPGLQEPELAGRGSPSPS